MWEGLDDAKVQVIAPSIDAFNAKNQELEPEQVDAILAAAGIVDGGDGEPTFKRGDGSEARVSSQAELFEDTRVTTADKIVLQVSRWDRLKDPEGVIRGFAEHALPRDGRPPDLRGPGGRRRLRRPRGQGGARGGEARCARGSTKTRGATSTSSACRSTMPRRTR